MTFCAQCTREPQADLFCYANGRRFRILCAASCSWIESRHTPLKLKEVVTQAFWNIVIKMPAAKEECTPKQTRKECHFPNIGGDV